MGDNKKKFFSNRETAGDSRVIIRELLIQYAQVYRMEIILDGASLRRRES